MNDLVSSQCHIIESGPDRFSSANCFYFDVLLIVLVKQRLF